MANIHALPVVLGPEGARRLLADLAHLHASGACPGPRTAQIDALVRSLRDQIRMLSVMVESLTAELAVGDADTDEAQRAVARLIGSVERVMASANACCE
ncbi:MAG: hypothetical protein K2X45_11890 [Phreatobacter sp.]|jgi:hypothetical protein|nr:hypothetical protein [Phreatobacter sp.]